MCNIQGWQNPKAMDEEHQEKMISDTGDDKTVELPSLEALALDRYLSYLEAEAVSYVTLSQSPGLLFRGLAERHLRLLKEQLDENMSGIASSVLREKMMRRILSEEFPTAKHCQRVAASRRV